MSLVLGRVPAQRTSQIEGYVSGLAGPCLNGHEWAKRQSAKQGVAFTVPGNGFPECDEPERLQAVCDSLGRI